MINFKGHLYDLENTRAFAFRKHMAMLTQAQLKVANADSLGAPGVEAFCAVLRRRFGTIASAWRVALDPDLKGRLSFNEFVNVARSIGYSNNLKLLWNQLDVDRSGFISLNELDAEAATALDSFRDLLIKKYGTTLNAWKHMDVDKNDRLDIHELEERCKELGYTGNARKLFFHLKTDVSRSFLTLADIDPQAMIARMRGDHNMLLAKTVPSFTQVASDPASVSPQGATTLSPNLTKAHSQPRLSTCSTRASRLSSISRSSSVTSMSPSDTRNSRWTLQQSIDLLRERHERKEKQEEADLGVKSLDGLKRLLLVRYGGYYAAWRQALDFDGNERLSFGEFCLALRELGFVGNAKSAWKALDRDGDGFIELKDLDEKTAEEITSYRTLVKEKFGHMLAGWLEGICKNGHGGVDEKTFARHCEDIGYSHDVRSLFNNLKNDGGRKFLTLRDYDGCAFAAFVRGDLGMVSEASGAPPKKSPNELTFHQRNEASFRIRWSRVQSKLHRGEMQELADEDRNASMAASDFPSFKKLLLRKYGTITAAWKHALDPDGNGKLSFGEFCDSLRKLGYCGSVKHLWQELDKDKSGIITLDEIDSKAHASLTAFRKLMSEKFGSWLKLWHALDANRNGRVDEDEFIEALKPMEYEGCSKQLFKYLLDRPGVTFLTMSDLDPDAASEHYRGPQVCKRTELEKMSLRDKEKLKGAQSLKQLKKLLVAKYGSIPAAWKHGLDFDGNGRLSFVEFCQALREIGYVGNIREMFQSLDEDNSGYISMDEFDPQAAAAIASFRELVLAKYGDFIKAWKHFDRDRNGNLDRDEFVDRVTELGYKGNPRLLFKYHLDKPGMKTLQLGDLDAEAGREQFRDQQRRDSKAHRNSIAKAQEEMKKADIGIQDVKGLKALLIKRCGTITAAWKHLLDNDGNGKVSFVEFCLAMRDVGFKGNMKKLWKELDQDGSGFITLDELDPEGSAAIKEFRHLAIEKYGNFLEAWGKFDSNKTNSVDIDEFVTGCADLGYSKDARKLFKYLLDKPGLTFLTLADIDAEAAQELYRDPNRLNSKFRRESMNAAWQAERDKIKGATDLESFKALLIKKHGTVTRAWQHELDMDGNGKLSFVEFCQALRNLGFAGNVKALWRELDQDGSGQITLDEICPKAHQIVSEFKIFVQEHFADYKEAWRSMDAKNKLMVSEDDFAAWCSEYGFKPHPQLFKHLVDKPSEKWLKEDVFSSPHFASCN
eukprot:TRINITY_DN1791_c0_g2_i1.p1 TRINITY_DN1791_c0_g2~~TRINITY_DN1791_c0_g2_i1.p1  ORF type:complete len:1251 (-),score=231.11 TRINITY_DN1791_c0_g2_i1:58-3738(-)